VLDRLHCLSAVLAGGNPSALNVELALHIDRIAYYEGGRVVVRTCRLGALAAAANLVRDEALAGSPGRRPAPRTVMYQVECENIIQSGRGPDMRTGADKC